MDNPAILPFARLRQDSGVFLLFPEQPARAGRGKENEIVINERNISRVHAVFEWTGAGFVLRDLDSINGTFVNGARLGADPLPLANGDRVTFGDLTYIYELLAPSIESSATGPVSGRRVMTGSLETAPLDPAVAEDPPSSAADSHGPRLVVAAGPDMGQQFPLWGEEITIGRASREATWEIRLSDRSISRPHARLYREGDQFWLVDLASANGTQVNGQPVRENPVALIHGDTITVGESELVFIG